ncbi:MAG: DUF1800 family protein, partial [Acidimicrobiia bacterium]
LLDMEVPLELEDATDIAMLAAPVQSWITSMVESPRLIEERLVWFWHDHFSTAIQKVRIPYLLWRQHLTLREHATGSFRELLNAIATDPAMLLYLDGARNNTEQTNENFAREVMELHTMGPGNYSQTDVTEAAKALTGWVVNVPYATAAQRFLSDYEPWEAVFIPQRHYSDPVTILGVTGMQQLPDVLDILLNQSPTAEFVSSKLWSELVGTQPEPETVASLAEVFRENYSTMALVEAIAWHPGFIDDTAIRAKVRTPVERLVAIAQGFGSREVDERLGFSLHGMAYLPFNPPSPAGYPRGSILLGPHKMVHAFDLLAVAEPAVLATTDDLTARIGLIDISDATRAVLESATDQVTKGALVINSPEFALV